ncbi:hypothetical protein KUTeg_009024 [Tegillarca granosa]|uniref:C2H2-type domain-containing protein n=1 Tax=Tegillarca granosa TaxID=220873 RepID=A0ABQ9F9U9_TEGGR|nr:hypothetical protein KUTeg_009024 [Tegillarca granosa]
MSNIFRVHKGNMQVKPDVFREQTDIPCHQMDIIHHQSDDVFRQEYIQRHQSMVMDLSKSTIKPRNGLFAAESMVKPLEGHLDCSNSEALDLSAPKYKDVESKNDKGQRLEEEESDMEEGRLIIDDEEKMQTSESHIAPAAQRSKGHIESLDTKPSSKFHLANQKSEITNLGKVKGDNSAEEDVARQMLYQQFLKNKENGLGKHFENNNIKTEYKSADMRIPSQNSIFPVFPNMDVSNPMQFNLAQTLMFMNMNGMAGNGLMPYLNPVVSTEHSSKISEKLNGKISNKMNTDTRRENIGAVKNVTSTRKTRIATGNQKVDKSVVEIYECKVCNRKFSQVGNFHNHMRTHSVQEDKVCVCGNCKMEFGDSYELQRHMRTTHTGDMPYKCEQCDREFSQYNNLRRHLRVHNGNMYKCQICGRTFNESFYLEMHLSSHTGERTYKCGICSFTCKDNGELQVHIKSHRADELHTCDVCNKSFSKACVLRQHKKMHTGIRPFKCDVCSKSFIHRHHLTIHSRMHSTNRPYRCKICGKDFAQTSHLYKHIRQHNEDSLSGVEMKRLLEELKSAEGYSENKISHISPQVFEPQKSDKNIDDKLSLVSPQIPEVSKASVDHKLPQIHKLCKSEMKNKSPETSDFQKEELNFSTTELHRTQFDTGNGTSAQGVNSTDPSVSQMEGFLESKRMEQNSLKSENISTNPDFGQQNVHVPKMSQVEPLLNELGEKIKEEREENLMNISKNDKISNFEENSHLDPNSNLELLSNTVTSMTASSAELCPFDNVKKQTEQNRDYSDKMECDSEKLDQPKQKEQNNNNQVLMDKIINQDDPNEGEVTKESEILSTYPHKQTKENADTVGGLVAKLLQEKNNAQLKSTEKKRRASTGKRKTKSSNHSNGENLFRPIVPPPATMMTPENHQIYLMQLQQMQAVQLAMMNSVAKKELFHYHGDGLGYPVSPNMHINNKRFDFEQFQEFRNLPAGLDEIKNRFEYARKFYENYQIGQGHLAYRSPNGVLDMSKDTTTDLSRFWSNDFVNQKTMRNSPGRFSSPSLSDELSDEAIDMSSKRSYTGSVSSQLSEDTVESE